MSALHRVHGARAFRRLPIVRGATVLAAVSSRVFGGDAELPRIGWGFEGADDVGIPLERCFLGAARTEALGSVRQESLVEEEGSSAGNFDEQLAGESPAHPKPEIAGWSESCVGVREDVGEA